MAENNLKIETELNEISKKLVDSIDDLIELKKMIHNTSSMSVNQLLMAFQAQFENEKDAIEESIRKDNEKIVEMLKVKISDLENEIKDITQKSMKQSIEKTSSQIPIEPFIGEISSIVLNTFKEKFTINDKILSGIIDISNTVEKRIIDKIKKINEVNVNWLH